MISENFLNLSDLQKLLGGMTPSDIAMFSDSTWGGGY